MGRRRQRGAALRAAPAARPAAPAPGLCLPQRVRDPQPVPADAPGPARSPACRRGPPRGRRSSPEPRRGLRAGAASCSATTTQLAQFQARMIARESRRQPVLRLRAGGAPPGRRRARGPLAAPRLDLARRGPLGADRAPARRAPGLLGGAGRRRPAAPPGRRDPRGRARAGGLHRRWPRCGPTTWSAAPAPGARRRRDLPRPDPRDGRQPPRGRTAAALARAAGRRAGGLRARPTPRRWRSHFDAAGRPEKAGAYYVRPRGEARRPWPSTTRASSPPGMELAAGAEEEHALRRELAARWPTPAGRPRRPRNSSAPARPPARTRSRSCAGPWRSSS